MNSSHSIPQGGAPSGAVLPNAFILTPEEVWELNAQAIARVRPARAAPWLQPLASGDVVDLEASGQPVWAS